MLLLPPLVLFACQSLTIFSFLHLHFSTENEGFSNLAKWLMLVVAYIMVFIVISPGTAAVVLGFVHHHLCPHCIHLWQGWCQGLVVLKWKMIWTCDEGKEMRKEPTRARPHTSSNSVQYRWIWVFFLLVLLWSGMKNKTTEIPRWSGKYCRKYSQCVCCHLSRNRIFLWQRYGHTTLPGDRCIGGVAIGVLSRPLHRKSYRHNRACRRPTKLSSNKERTEWQKRFGDNDTWSLYQLPLFLT